MDKNNVLKAVGAVGIVGGSVALYFAGVGESTIAAVVAGAFVLVGVVVGIFKNQ